MEASDGLSVHADVSPSGGCCRRHRTLLLVLLAWRFGLRSMGLERTRYGTSSLSSCLHIARLTTWSCKARARASKCGVLKKQMKFLLVGRSNLLPPSLACLWSSGARRCGDFLAAPLLWLHGSRGSRCASAVCEPDFLYSCESLTVLLGLYHVPTGTAKRAHKSSCVCSVCGPTHARSVWSLV